MSAKHLKIDSHKVRGMKDAWWYEESWGISVVVEHGVLTKVVKIPWREIRNALARADKR